MISGGGGGGEGGGSEWSLHHEPCPKEWMTQWRNHTDVHTLKGEVDDIDPTPRR